MRAQFPVLAGRRPDADNFIFNFQKSTQLNRVTLFKIFCQIAPERTAWERRSTRTP